MRTSRASAPRKPGSGHPLAIAIAASLLLGLAWLPALVSADDGPAADADTVAEAEHASAPEPTPPDLVMTHSGGLIRGVIVESVPGEHVVIRVAGGEDRRLDWTDVRFAGRTEDAPASTLPEPPSAPSVEATPDERVNVRFVSSQAGLTLHRAHSGRLELGPGSQNVEPRREVSMVCHLPCEQVLDVGRHQFGLSIEGRPPRLAPAIDIESDGRLRAEYIDNGPTLIAGLVAAIAGPLLSSIALGVPFLLPEDHEAFIPLLAASAVNGPAGIILGLRLIELGLDTAVIRYD